MIALVAALCAASAVWWLLPSGAAAMTRLASGEEGAAATARASGGQGAGRRRRRTRSAASAGARRWLLGGGVVAGTAVIGAGILAGPGAGAVALALAQLAACAVWLVRSRAGSRARVRRRAEVVRAGESIAGLLRVGRVPSEALREAAEDASVLARAAAEVAAGGEAAAALRHAAVLPGEEGLADLAAAWELSVRTGASLAPALDAAAARLASEQEVARVVEAELAAARLAGRMLACLPLVGLGLSFLMGGDPLAFLTGGVLGWLCLNLGVLLACGGVAWVETIAARAGGDR
ncbi:MAG: pilus assembly protein TadB [Propioniciclava sp.]|uniref:type II secretion system F family protein n=1 Tax=Propioniciclava sp. TaxID=2038686 RepID=UPI0039E22907